jgi:very-short-patch-repair endonuclease
MDLARGERGRLRRGRARGRDLRSWRLFIDIRRKGANAAIDQAIAELAMRPHGVFTSVHLAEVGVDSNAIARRVRSRRLYRLHLRVYSAIPPQHLKPEGHWLAAVYACGPGAVLSHLAAAALWGLRPPPAIIDVTVPTANGRKRRNGLRIHRSTSLTTQEATIRRGIPVTTAARTIADLRRMLPRREVAAAIAEAEVKRLPVGDRSGFLHEPTRSELERAFLRLCRRHRLPMPEVNVRVGPYTVDFLWREANVIVETDGFETHGNRSAFEADRARDADLTVMGYEVIRFTWRQLSDDPAVVAAIIRTVLSRAVSSPTRP